MKLKYYLRGLGIGIFVTALILGISFQTREKELVMTDEEVIVRAKELGLVEKTVLLEVEEKKKPLPEESEEVEEPLPEESEEVEEPLPEESEEVEEPLLEESKELEEPLLEESKEVEESKEAEVSKTVNFKIVAGDSSVSVSKRLEEVGLVENAYSCDSFLCQNGYDKNIQTGNYTIEIDATLEEIAKMITGN